MSKPRKRHSPVIQLIATDELFVNITDTMLPGVYDWYMVSNYGRVYSKYSDIIMKPSVDSAGYKFVVMHTTNGPKHVMIHRIEMLAFFYREDHKLYDVNHKDGNKLNDLLYNLEWTTHSENILHAYRTGLHPKGEQSPQSIITEQMAREACELLSTNLYTNQEIADIIGSPMNSIIVGDIKKRACWADVSEGFIFYSRPGKLFDNLAIENICKYFENNPIGNFTINDHCRNALNFYGYDSSDRMVDSARKIFTRKYYTNISNNYKF